MKRRMTLCLMLILLCVTSGVAQSAGTQPSATALSDIRRADFLNFTYRSSLCAQEYGRNGIGRAVRVRNGEFRNRNVYFAVAEDKIIYADVTGDGREDAIVSINCGASTANFARSEVYIYTIQNGRAALLAGISDRDMERDYRRHYSDAASYWGINENGLRVRDGGLEIEVLADGSHAAPQHIVTLEYRLSGATLSLNGRPTRRNSTQ